MDPELNNLLLKVIEKTSNTFANCTTFRRTINIKWCFQILPSSHNFARWNFFSTWSKIHHIVDKSSLSTVTWHIIQSRIAIYNTLLSVKDILTEVWSAVLLTPESRLLQQPQKKLHWFMYIMSAFKALCSLELLFCPMEEIKFMCACGEQ